MTISKETESNFRLYIGILVNSKDGGEDLASEGVFLES